jgi:hypothetical protein
MYTIEANTRKNRLYVTLHGFFEYNEMKECTDKTINESKKLKPGYDVITDISQFKAVGKETLPEIRRGQVHFLLSGVRHAMRVRGGAILTSIQFARTGKTVNYVPATVATMADAERYLDRQARLVGAV